MSDTRNVLSVLLILLIVFGTFGCRAHRIDDCRDKGGEAVVPHWFTDEPHDVRCIYPVGG